jgi:hypothetical protein
MKISYSYPPNIKEIKTAFGQIGENVIFTYGDTIYNPNKKYLDVPLLCHEAVHSEQQGVNPGRWWRLYLKNPYFRLSQEVPAYQIQFREAKRFSKDIEALNKYATALAEALSGPMYGGIMTFGEALLAIKRKRLYTFKTAPVPAIKRIKDFFAPK